MKSTTLFASVVLFAVCVYLLHIPLPAGLCDRYKVQFVEFILRIVHLYPNNVLKLIGPNWQLFWTRLVMNNLVLLFNPYTSRDSDLKISDSMMNGVQVRIYEPNVRFSDGAIIFIHGGGFVLFGVDAFEGPVREIARMARMLTISIEYRLAPEHPFPAGLEDCLAVTRYFLSQGHKDFGVDPSRVALVGDSAGGNIVAVIAHRLAMGGRGKVSTGGDRGGLSAPQRDYDGPKLAAQVLLYPWLQFVDFLTPSYQMYKVYSGSAMLDPSLLARLILHYAGIDLSLEPHLLANSHLSDDVIHRATEALDHDLLPSDFHHSKYEPTSLRTCGNATSWDLLQHPDFPKLQTLLVHPDLSPLFHGDLSRMPNTFLATGEFDILRDDGYFYQRRLRQAGVPVEYRNYDGGFHGMINFHYDIPVGQKVLYDTASYLRRQLCC